jgi:hypothetical protein
MLGWTQQPAEQLQRILSTARPSHVVWGHAVWAGLALSLPHEMLTLIPAMAVVFVVGRALFWIGYLIAPVARALGMGLSAYPTFVALIWLAGRMFLSK